MASRMSMGRTVLLLCLVASAGLLFFTGTGILQRVQTQREATAMRERIARTVAGSTVVHEARQAQGFTNGLWRTTAWLQSQARRILLLVVVLTVGFVGLGCVYAWHITRDLTHAMAAGELAPSQQAGSPSPVNTGRQRLGRVTVRHRADLL